MKKNFKKKTAAVVCFVSLLLTLSTTGCSKAQNKDSNDKASSQVSVSETSDISSPASSGTQSQTSQTSEKQSSGSKTSETTSSSESSDKQSQTSEASRQETSSDEKSETASSSAPETSHEQSQTSESSSQESSPASASSFSYSEDDSGNIILTKYNGREAAPEIPSSIDGKKVTAIGESCFAGNTAVKTISIPEGISQIGDYAFECCTYLAGLTLPASLRTIGEGAFSACIHLPEAVFPDNLEVIRKGAFLYCSALKELELPAGLQEIGNFAFSNCSSVTSVSIKSTSLQKLSDRLFCDCTKLTEVRSQYPLESIGAETFRQCTSLTTVSLPAALQSVGDYAFDCCTALTEVPVQADFVSGTAYHNCYNIPGYVPSEEDENDRTRPGRSYDLPKPDTLGSIAGSDSLFGEARFAGYHSISNDEFEQWSQQYVDFCKQNNIPASLDELFYTKLYKGEFMPHYTAMAAVENHDPDMMKQAERAFGKGYEETYRMIDHGLYTELRRGKMFEDVVLYSGVYDSQLIAAAGTDEVPTLEQLKDAVGTTFTDPIMISTSTDIGIACNFSSTVFIIYASKESINNLGAVSIDSIAPTVEKEVLMSSNAAYRILDVGTMAVDTNDSHDGSTQVYRNYVKVELL